MFFVLISEQTAIMSLHCINRLVFITEAECVWNAVRTESLNINFILFINVNIRLQGVKETFIITTDQANCPLDCVRSSTAQNQLS